VFVDGHMWPDGVAVLRLGGRLNVAAADARRPWAADLVGRGHSRAAVDLAKVEFIDPFGLGAL
jgi:anti-anti-sigma regulatory factor